MTRGPIDPPITGRSIDLPVSLSVSVTVPVTMLLPSIDPPLSLSLLAVAGFHSENKPVAGTWQTATSSRRSCCVRDPSEALLLPQSLHHDQNPQRAERAGHRRAQRMSAGATLCPL